MSDEKPHAVEVAVAPLTGKQLRDRILGKQHRFKQRQLRIDFGEGDLLDVIVREPSAQDRSRMYREAGMKPKANGDIEVADPEKLKVWGVILCTHSLGGDRVFANDSADALMQLPSSSYVAEIFQVVMELISAATEAGKT